MPAPPILVRVFAVLSALVPASTAAPVLAQSDLDRCQIATPEFPQACGCVIARSEAAGITGPTLSRLLSNDMGGLPMEVFQRYGLIYVQCIQEAVLAGATAVPVPPVLPPAVSGAPQPAPTPTAPVGQSAPGTGGGMPVVIGRADLPGADAPWRIDLRDPLAAGEWGLVGLERPGRGLGGPGAHDGQGRIVYLDCRGGDFLSPRLILGGVPAYPDLVEMRLEVQGGDGAVLWSERRPAVPAEGAFLVTALRRGLADAIRAGSRLTLALADGTVIAFGLSGSNRAIGPGVCGAERFLPGSFILDDQLVPQTRWIVVDRPGDLLPEPVLTTTGAEAGQLARLEMTCDGRMAMRAGWLATNLIAPDLPLTLHLTPDAPWDDARQIALTLAPMDRDYVSDPLAPGDLAAIEAARVLYASLVYFEEPGGFHGFALPMDGFAEARASLACPTPPPAPGEVAVIDLTGLGLRWMPGDFGRAFDGMAETPAPVPGAILDVPDGVPGFVLQCDGTPWTYGDWPQNGPDFTLRMTVDGDAATTRDVRFTPSRSQHFPDVDSYDLGERVLAGRTLRITSLIDPSVDVVYPLDGLGAALAAAGC